jgi:hypothetical protein
MGVDAWVVAAWLRDEKNAEPCRTYPADPARAAGPGLYAFHADDVARELFACALGEDAPLLYVGQAGSSARRSHVASGETLDSAVARSHLGGGSASSFRRSVAALLWYELRLQCDGPKRLAPASNARLTVWMLDHLRVATVPVDDRSTLWLVQEYVGHVLDPPLNLDGYENTRARARLRDLRARHFSSLSGPDDERVGRFLDMERLVAFGAS